MSISPRLLLPLLALTAPALGQCPDDDWREDNDDCAAALATAGGTQFGLVVRAADPDHFLLEVGAGEVLDVRVRFRHADGDIDAFLFDAAAGCAGAPLASGTSLDDDELLSITNGAAVAMQYVLRVELVSGTCNGYDLQMTLPPGVASCPGPDILEPNDSLATATHLAPGAQTRLNSPLAGDTDFYSFVVPVASSITINTFEFNIDPTDSAGLLLYNFDGSVTLDFDFAQGTSLQQVTWSNDTGAPALVNAQFVFQVGASSCLEYSMLVVVEAVDCPGADRFEPNDDCGSASPVMAGLLPDLTASRTNRDYYSVVVPAGGRLSVVADEPSVAPNDVVLLELRSADCATALASDFGVGATQQSVAWDNTSGLAEEVRIFFDFSVGTSMCLDYSLDVAIDTCGGTPDDGLEDNDTCATAGALPLGTTVGLRVFGDDADHYVIDLDNRTTLDIAVDFDVAGGTVASALYRGTTCAPAELVAVGTPTPAGEALLYTNDSGGRATFVLQITYVGALDGCNEYGLAADTTPGTLGAYVCAGVPNSTGVGAHMSATGSDAVLDNAVTLICDDLPLGSAGFFLNSLESNQIVQPGGSVGTLCIAGLAIGRHDNDILFSGTTGSVELQPDLSMLPRPTGPSAVSAGQTWYWQYWYRDALPGGPAVSNFSDALGITFL